MIQHLQKTLLLLWRLGTGLAFAVMIAVVLIQVFARSFLPQSPVWTEELSRFALIYIAAFGAGLAFRNGDLVHVDLICESLPGLWPKRLRFVSTALSMGLCVILVGPALDFMSIGSMQTSPAMHLQMTWVFLAIPFLIGSLVLFTGLRLVAMAMGRSDGRPEHEVGNVE